MHGFSYMQFIVPGLIMMSVITNAYANVASSFFGAKFQRNIEELLVAPVPTHVIIAGYVGGGVARGLFVGILVTAISLFFVPFQVHSWVFVALTLVLTAVLLSGVKQEHLDLHTLNQPLIADVRARLQPQSTAGSCCRSRRCRTASREPRPRSAGLPAGCRSGSRG